MGLNSAFTIQCIVKPDTQQYPFATILDNRDSTIGKRGFAIVQVPNANNTFTFVYGDNSNWISSDSFKLIAGKWNLLTISLDSNHNLKTFVNGVSQSASGINPPKNSTQYLIIGSDMGHSRPFNGTIRELKITNGVSTDDFTALPEAIN